MDSQGEISEEDISPKWAHVHTHETDRAQFGAIRGSLASKGELTLGTWQRFVSLSLNG